MKIYRNFFKRLIDFLLALIALLILSPILAVCMIVLILTGEHEVFYFQKRMGYKNRPFFIWKFATMLKNSEKMGPGTITVRKDPRVLPFGRFLRKTKMNELPQIFNVLLGTMSVVGARPLVISGFEQYSDEIKAKVYATPPGITGIGSIVFRDEEHILSQGGNPQEIYNTKIAPYKGALELWYQKNISFWVDIKIIILTFWVIIFPKSELHYKWLKGLPQKPEYL
ncbi:MAG: sugar transferase [Marinilabiliaceae bacterium]|nr:sugar transferase [Marinilabiliaceae bacterium]